MRRFHLVVLIAVVAMVAAGCGRQNEDRDEVLAALRATAAAPRQFRVVETVGDQKVITQGVIADDFRYRARVSVNGDPLFEQIVSDDALAIRVLDQERLSAALSPSGGSLTGNPEADAALREGRWVVDRNGAPPLTSLVRRGGPVAGRDPVADVIATVPYVERTMGETIGLFKYSPESIDYKPSEDPFPTPEDESGIDRFDYLRAPLPRPAQQGGGGASRQFPGEQHFRKLSIYVKDRRVTQIKERIQFDERLDDSIDYLEAQLKEAGLPANVLRDITKEMKSANEVEQAEGALAAFNTALETNGRDPIRFREVHTDFTHIGKSNEVTLPTEAVEGELGAFFPEIDDTDDALGGAVPGLGGAATSSTTSTSAVPLGTEPSESTTTSTP